MQKIIIDTDCGGDDAVAIAMALKDPNVKVLMLSTVVGNVPMQQATINTLTTLGYAKSYNPPVYKGCKRPLLREPLYAYETHGEDGMGDIGLVPQDGACASEGHGAVKILETLLAHQPKEIDIVCLGPLTNIAVAIALSLETMSRAKSIIIMGSAGFGAGNVTPVAEFNIWHDAEAAKAVLASGLPITFVGWDACLGDAIFTEAEISRLKEAGHLGDFMVSCNKSLISFNMKRFGREVLDFADPVAMAVALWPEVITQIGGYWCEVDTTLGPGYGSLVIDRNNEFGKPNAKVCTEVDANLYKEKIFNLVK